MTKIVVPAILCCLLCSCIVTNTEEWPLFMHDLQHTGYSFSTMPESLSVLWEFKKPLSSLTYVIVSEEKVFAAFIPRCVCCLDITSGSLYWETSGSIEGFPAVGKNKERIYVGLDDGFLCLDSMAGNVLWEYEDIFAAFGSPPIVVDEYVYVGSASEFTTFIDVWDSSIDHLEHQRRLLCFNAKTGEIVWEFRGKDAIFTSPSYYDGEIYTSDRHSVYCLDAEVGEVVWEKEMKGASYLSLSQDGERIFVVSRGEMDKSLERLNCLQRDNGELLWYYDCRSSITSPSAVGYGKVFFGSHDGTLYCVDTAKGDLLWKREMGTSISAPVPADKKIAIGAGAVLYILNAKSGDIIESYKTETAIESIALSDGKLVVGEVGGKILCLGSSQKGFLYQVAFIIAILVIAALVIYLRKRTQ